MAYVQVIMGVGYVQSARGQQSIPSKEHNEGFGRTPVHRYGWMAGMGRLIRERDSGEGCCVER
jgi:hypothetical protein